jgi:hypothetical protein
MSALGFDRRGAFAPQAAASLRPWQRGWQRWLSRLTQSKASAQDTRFTDARAVRELARTVHSTDPGFAADLYAAADRHEQQPAANWLK